MPRLVVVGAPPFGLCGAVVVVGVRGGAVRRCWGMGRPTHGKNGGGRAGGVAGEGRRRQMALVGRCTSSLGSCDLADIEPQCARE